MKNVKFWFVIMSAAALTLGLSSMALAFHSGGVAECVGCHSMHAPKAGGSYLLIGSDPSSTCLSCHEKAGDTGPNGYHVSTASVDLPGGVPPKQRTPGGDFGWLRKAWSFIPRTGAAEVKVDGSELGHNIVALDQSYSADPTHTTAPGGTFPSSQLGCQSCHDPHGQTRRLSNGTLVKGGVTGQATAPIIGSGSYNNSPTPAAGEAVGVYRLLRGNGDTYSGASFTASAIAVAPSTYNQTEATNQVRVAYGASGTNTWGNWCATCHPDMLGSSNRHVHPIDETLDTEIVNNYNAYVKSGDLTGAAATSYTSLVPFMEGTGVITTLQSHASNTDAYLNGPSTSDRVSCLSCHRAHASGFENMLRWQMEGEFIVYNSLYPGTNTTPTKLNLARGRTSAETQAAYYDRPVTKFASYQRGLCNKCHAKD
jgi:predicted CXXCH cytochrome family protein